MEYAVLVGIALGLSLDAFAVAVTSSAVIHGLQFKHGLRMAIFFGFFQMIMPVIGWAAGITFSKYISGFDHWVAFGLLAFVGGRMVWSGLPCQAGRQQDNGGGDKPRDCRDLPTLLILAIATSIDAMAVGLSFAMINLAIVMPVIIIGLITFLVSLGGYFIGSRLGHRINFPLEILGGIVLILIGLKILIDHLC